MQVDLHREQSIMIVLHLHILYCRDWLQCPSAIFEKNIGVSIWPKGFAQQLWVFWWYKCWAVAQHQREALAQLNIRLLWWPYCDPAFIHHLNSALPKYSSHLLEMHVLPVAIVIFLQRTVAKMKCLQRDCRFPIFVRASEWFPLFLSAVALRLGRRR